MKLSRRINASELTLIIQFILLSTVLTAFTIEGKNILFMGFSVLGAIALLILNRKFPVNTSRVIFIMLLLLTVSYLINFKTADHLSFVYSVFFICSFVIFTSFFKQKISLETFRNVAFSVLVLYLIMLIVGQGYVFLGFFKGTYISRGLLHGPYGTLFEGGLGFRFYSLSSEPSYAAFIVLCLLYVILETDPYQKPFGKKNLYAWLITVYMLFSFQSGYGVLLFLILILFKTTPRNIFIMLTIGLVVVIGALIAKQPALTRVVNIISNLRLDQLENIGSIDHSASFRILPTYYYLKGIELTDLHFYFGHGAGQSTKFLVPYLFKVKVESYEGGFLPQFLYDYGIVFGFFFLLFLKREVLTRFFSFETFVILLMLTNANFNTQLFWLVITIFALTKFYKKSSLYGPPSSLQNLKPATI